MNILEQIIIRKKMEVAERKESAPFSYLEKEDLFTRQTLSLKHNLHDKSKTGIIAEFKRKSPSKGIINDQVNVAEITAAYTDNGASGLSILTDEYFFGGSIRDVVMARHHNIPILRKDFIIDEYQLIEAKAMGADVILLIAACLSPAALKTLAVFAKKLGLEVLLEIHEEKELHHICDEVDIVGVNNRDLKTFEVNIERSVMLSEKIPADKTKISESGINAVQTIAYLKTFGFKGFLIGENFMKAKDPAIAFATFVNQLKVAGA